MVPKQLRKSPQAEHVKAYAAYRLRQGKPKAILAERAPLTLKRYSALMEHYQSEAEEHKRQMKENTSAQFQTAHESLAIANKERRIVNTKNIDMLYKNLRQELLTTISPSASGHAIAREISGDFRRTKGLRVFGFGVGYGQLLFFLKKFMGAKVRGVDLEHFARNFTRGKGLNITYGVDAGDKSLGAFGKFDVTYSINLLETDIVDRESALRIIDNAANLTRKGGKSYHVILSPKLMPVSIEEIKARGFRIDKMEPIMKTALLVKLTKIED